LSLLRVRHLVSSPELVSVGRPFTLIEQGGNQCAIVVDAYSPCKLEIEGRAVDWRMCERVKLMLHRGGGATS